MTKLVQSIGWVWNAESSASSTVLAWVCVSSLKPSLARAESALGAFLMTELKQQLWRGVQCRTWQRPPFQWCLQQSMEERRPGFSFPEFLSGWSLVGWAPLSRVSLFAAKTAGQPASFKLEKSQDYSIPNSPLLIQNYDQTSAPPLPNLTRQQSSQFQCEERARLFTCHRSWHNLEWRFCCIIILFVRGSLSNEESFKGFEVGKESRRWLPRSCRTDAKKNVRQMTTSNFFRRKILCWNFEILKYPRHPLEDLKSKTIYGTVIISASYWHI